MNNRIIQLSLWVVIVVLAWLVYRSPIKLKEFQELSDFRKSAVIQDLKDIRTAQIAFKDKYKVYANNFNSLISFVKSDSLAVVKAIGEVPDSLSEEQALKIGIISRDTVLYPSSKVFSTRTISKHATNALNLISTSFLMFHFPIKTTLLSLET